MGPMLWHVDWHGLLTPTHSLLEMVVRGTVMYVVIFAFMRLVLKRQAGGVGTTDVLVIVLVAEVAGNGFSAEYTSMVEGTVLVGTVLVWTYVLEWLPQRFPTCERFLRPEPLLLIEDGRLLRKNMRAELVTEAELMAQLREKGLEDYAKVRRACMEADGMISIIKMDP